ncbi:hypothetical protein CGJ66_23025 [Vibrio parahaemolyticus]|nr:hypothetical protein CGJ66_23025 [Vibrio parahaemolyticus]
MIDIYKLLPSRIQKDIAENALTEYDFLDETVNWYSPFILYSQHEVRELQPSYDSDFQDYIAIGSNGGGEAYMYNCSNGGIYVCDLISGYNSLEKVSDCYSELYLLLVQ